MNRTKQHVGCARSNLLHEDSIKNTFRKTIARETTKNDEKSVNECVLPSDLS